MNNIEILKDLEKYIGFANKQCNFSNDADYKWHKELAEAIENLIQENKKLKEKIEEYEKQLDLDYVEENYIPKLKLKEKIEELKKEEKQELKGLKGQDRYFVKQTYQAKAIVLQELLEEGE